MMKKENECVNILIYWICLCYSFVFLINVWKILGGKFCCKFVDVYVYMMVIIILYVLCYI